jgi:hypothetical protein
MKRWFRPACSTGPSRIALPEAMHIMMRSQST